ncbi:MAG: signal transduction histidine kinase, LytS, partial [Bacteroidota bacterium]|nr:signal transduction histidine kinase, LytS [Bacteroidota bacterium]
LSGIRYKVRLNGSGAWKYTNQNFIQYFNLAPGEYELEVAAEDKFGKYRSEIRSLNFIIHPRFIDTALFKSLVFLLILLVVVMLVYLVFNYQRLKAKNLIKLLQAEFKALNYQINPHFIFNVLNSIQYYILRKDTDNAVHMLSSFSMLIRKIVNNSKQQYISVIEELECLKEYMDLEKVRLDNKFEYEINIDISIDLEKKEILPMILQPLVENSIWHGIVPSGRPGRISIDFKKENGQIICVVEDNGVGINSKGASTEKGHNNLSLAMKNVSERLKIISELNSSTWDVKTEDKSNLATGETGTIVTVLFPAVKDIK